MRTSEKIKKVRTEKGYTQKKLSELSGVSEIAIRKYETNNRSPKIETLQKLSKALEVPLSDLRSDNELELELLTEKITEYMNYEIVKLNNAIQERQSLLDDFEKLNDEGKKEARKRIRELTQIKEYTEIEHILPEQ